MYSQRHPEIFEGEETKAEVKAYPSGTSVYGCEQMSGNVEEWCDDWYDEEAHRGADTRNPGGLEIGSTRVSRGGSWGDDAQGARVSFRSRGPPGNTLDYLGFRLSRSFP